MAKALSLHQSTIGKKALLAVSGLVLFGFTIAHMAGNLNLYRGPAAINEYSAMLHSIPAVLWGTRLVLLLSVALHVSMAFQLSARNSEARPQGYRVKRDLVTSYAARTMKWTGPILLAYLIYHLLHLTVGVTVLYEFEAGNVYDNVVLGFRQPIIAATYLIGNLALGVHLMHGVWSLTQTLGLSHPRYNALRGRLALAGAGVVVLGNLSFPIAVLAGVVKPSSELAPEVTAAPEGAE